jgi:hypothetical protein
MELLPRAFKEEGMTENERLTEHVRNQIEIEEWQSMARAAGWSPPIPSRLRVVEKCPNCDGKGRLTWLSEECVLCTGTGTILRHLTPEETVKALELAIACRDNDQYPLTLASGLKVVMEDNDEG